MAPSARAVFFAALALATAAFLAPVGSPPGGAPTWWDKAAHAAVFAGLAFLVRPAFAARRALPLFVALVAYGAAVELLQASTPWRRAEAWDVLADALGSLVVFARR